MQDLMVDGTPVTVRYTAHFSTVRDGVYRVEVSTSGPVGMLVDELSRSYDSRPLASAICEVLNGAFQAGGRIPEARAAATSFLHAQLEFLLAHPEAAATDAGARLQTLVAFFESGDLKAWSAKLIADINAHLDRVHGVANTQSTTPGNGDHGRSAQVTGQPQTMADTVPVGEHRQVPPTAAGAHNTPLSEPLRQIITVAASLGGTILRSKAANARQLRAVARKGLVTLTYRPGSSRPDPVSATLTERGWRQAGTAVAP